jgi:hypothetical protein
MIPYIVNEPSPVVRDQLVKVLAKRTGVTLKAINQELNLLLDEKAHKQNRERQSILDDAMYQLRNTPSEAESILQKTQGKLLELVQKHSKDSLSSEDFLRAIDRQKTHEEEINIGDGGFKLGPDLKDMEESFRGDWSEGVLMFVGAKPNCFPIDTKLMDPYTGQLVVAKELSHVNSLKGDNTICVQECTNLDTTPKECFEVEVQRGYKIQTSGDHRYLTPDGYKELRHMQVGDYVAQPSKLRYFDIGKGNSLKDFRLGFLFGAMIGDGKTSENKFIPKSVFSASFSYIRGVLNSLFSSDGTIDSYRSSKYTKHTISFCTISEQLARQVQHLLLRFEINAALSFKKNDYKGAWVVKFSNHNKIRIFGSKIGFTGKKQQRLLSILSELKDENIKESNVEWAKIKSIKSVGIKECCDITVANTHNFIVDGFVLHNSGKSAFLSKLAYSIAKHNDDVVVIYHTIDDTAEQLLPRFVSIAEGSRRLSINMVRQPNYWAKTVGIEGLTERRDFGYQKIREFAQDGKLVIKDIAHGCSIPFIENLICYYKDQYPDRRVVFLLDNFHKLRDFDRKDERVRFKAMSEAIKSITLRHRCCIVSSIEYTKLAPGIKPTNHNIAESVQLEFDASAIIHIYNEVADKPDDFTVCHEDIGWDGQTQYLPRNEFIIGKNKVSEVKKSFFLDFWPAASDFRSINHKQVLLEAKEMKEKSPSNSKFSQLDQIADQELGEVY